jgi:heptosyltransferase-2
VDAEVRAVLVILPTWVGDFVMSTPTLRAIRERFAAARITFLMESNLRELVRGGDWMDECLEWPVARQRLPWSRAFRRLVRELRGRRFDWAILLPNSFRAAWVAFRSGARRRIGFDRDGRGWLLTDRVPVPNRRRNRQVTGNDTFGGIPFRGKGPFFPMRLVNYYAGLAEAVGCRRPDDRLELFTTPDCDAAVEQRLAASGLAGHHPLVVLSPGAKFGAAKCWLPERFAAVADRLIEDDGAEVVVTCGPGEEPIAESIGRLMQRRGHVWSRPRLTLGELKSLIRCCDLLVCNDAGPRHFAKAFGVGVVTIFGPTHPEWTATAYAQERIVRVDVDCGPCQQRVCPLGHLQCMKGVTVEAVVHATREMLSPHGGQASVPAQSAVDPREIERKSSMPQHAPTWALNP